MPPPPRYHSPRYKQLAAAATGSPDNSSCDKDEASSCIIGWKSQTRKVKEELLRNRIDEKRKKRTNYHRKNKGLQIGDIITAKVGKQYKKPNGKNTLRQAEYSKITESRHANEYVVQFVNNTVMTLKSSQIVKAKDISIYFKLTETDTNPAPTSL